MARAVPVSAARTGARARWQVRWRKWRSGYLFVLPSMLMFLVFLFGPVLWSLLLAFQDASLTQREWIGLDNFVGLADDRVFRKALVNTLIYTAITVPVHLLVSLILAGMMKPLAARWQTFFRAAYYLPAVTSVVILATVWRWMFNPRFGVFNQLLDLGAVPWLARPNLALWAVIISAALTIPAAGVVMYSAAMGSIPADLYEAAGLEGAGAVRQWWDITVPLLKPTTLYLVVMYTIWAFEVFERVYIMTGGGPAYATTTIVQLIYDTGFRDWQYGVASAQAIVLFVLVGTAAAIQFRYFRSDVEY
ncbi:MAG TPA: sugar ABC transporter permease [Thermomicrobiales bacterium]|nr:sugar ABC transporter permease [Thermomicrobiales bacterium]